MIMGSSTPSCSAGRHRHCNRDEKNFQRPVQSFLVRGPTQIHSSTSKSSLRRFVAGDCEWDRCTGSEIAERVLYYNLPYKPALLTGFFSHTDNLHNRMLQACKLRPGGKVIQARHRPIRLAVPSPSQTHPSSYARILSYNFAIEASQRWF